MDLQTHAVWWSNPFHGRYLVVRDGVSPFDQCLVSGKDQLTPAVLSFE